MTITATTSDHWNDYVILDREKKNFQHTEDRPDAPLMPYSGGFLRNSLLKRNFMMICRHGRRKPITNHKYRKSIATIDRKDGQRTKRRRHQMSVVMEPNGGRTSVGTLRRICVTRIGGTMKGSWIRANLRAAIIGRSCWRGSPIWILKIIMNTIANQDTTNEFVFLFGKNCAKIRTHSLLGLNYIN